MSFSEKTKKIIRKRAKYRSELSGEGNGSLEAAHLNHDRKNPDYDCPENGLLLTPEEHFYQHRLYQFSDVVTPADIGLNYHSNEWAVERLYERIAEARNAMLDNLYKES